MILSLFQIVMPDDCNTSAILEESRGHDYRSEPNLDLPDFSSTPLHRTFQSSPLQLDQFGINSRSLSLKQHRPSADKHRGLGASRTEVMSASSTAGASYKATFTPGTLSNRNGSLSYDSLLNPSFASPPPPSAGECAIHPGVPSMGFHSPYLPTKMCHVRGPELQRHPPPPVTATVTAAYSPVRVGGFKGRRSPHPQPQERDPSPVRYDNLSKTIMASIQERKELEEREKLMHLHGHRKTPPLASAAYAADSGVFDACSYGLPPSACYTDGPRGPGSQLGGGTYSGSRENLVGGGGGMMGYGQRTPVLRSAASSLARAPRTSSSSLHMDGRSTEPASYRSPAHQPHHSPAPIPRSPSYSHQKVSFISALERSDSPRMGSPRYES